MAGTIVKLGWTNPLTGVFGDHPVLGPVLDLNDGVTFTLAGPDALELEAPERTLVTAGNIRTQGERATRGIYRHNRQLLARVSLGPMGSYADLVATVRSLLSWLNATPTLPLAIQYQPVGASMPVYLDVVGAAHSIPADEAQWLRLQLEAVELVFVVRPALRGDRVTLSNLVPNPGFEAPAGGGTAQTMPQVFSDSFANTNAYAVQSGSLTLGADKSYYTDTLLATAPGSLLRYFRLGESASPAYDVTGSGNNLSIQGSGTSFNQTGLLTGDSDGAVKFNGSGCYTGADSGLPAGTSSVTLVVWFKQTAGGSVQGLVTYGTNANSKGWQLYLDSSNKVNFGIQGVLGISSSATTPGTSYCVAVTWDGSNARMYLNGALVAGPSGVGGTPSVTLAGLTLGGLFATPQFIGTIDEVAIFSGALSAGAVSALSTAGTTSPATVAQSVQLSSGARIRFGSPAWSALASWGMRLRYYAGATITWYLHFTDANNYLAAVLNSNTLTLWQFVGGTGHTLAQVAASPGNESPYWIRLTQFPSPPGDPPYVQATLYLDAGGSVGAQVASVAGPVFDSATALVGQPQVAVSGAALGIGGNSAGVHAVALFGPGAWTPASKLGSATGIASLAWDGTRGELGASGTATQGTQTYPNAPVVSTAAARIDASPAGTFDASWNLFSGGAPGGSNALAIKSAGDVLYAGVQVKSQGLGNVAQISLKYTEYDASGAALRGGTLASFVVSGGVQAAWATAGSFTLSGHWTTGASCAYVDLAVEASDASAGNSANATVWIDNAQAWDATATGTTSMPYCELRFPNSPSQLLVSGLQGDLPAPAYVAFGAYIASLAQGGALALALGRAPRASATAALVGASHGYYGMAFAPQATVAVDSASYGGFYVQAPVTSAGWNPRAFSPRPADAVGTYHLFERHLTKQAAGNLANVQVRIVAQQLSDPWYGTPNGTDQIGAYAGAWSAPFTSSNVWTVVDAGQVSIPPLGAGALTDLTQTYVTPRPQWSDATGGGALEQANWQLLLPVDGSLIVGAINNPSNAPFSVASQWLWGYFDGLAVASGGVAAWMYSLEAGAMPNPAHAGGGPGTQTSGTININAGADPYLTLDPTLQLGGSGAVNQVVAYIADGTGAVLPLHAELQYTPLYLWPR